MEYEKCLVELDEVLKYLSEDNLNKIPSDVLRSIKEQKSKDYIWKYDETKDLKSQNLNRKTIAMLCYLNMEYLLNDKQKEYMEKLYYSNELKAEEHKRENYNPDNIFNTTKQEIKQESEIKIEQEQKSEPASMRETKHNIETHLIETKENKWYIKIFNFIKRLFNKRK